MNKKTKSFGYKIGIVGSIASIIGVLLYFKPPYDKNLQLIVNVIDTHGNVVLENEGELNTSIGNRVLRQTIGSNGQTTFNDILHEYKGDSIQIGFKADGWELIDKNNAFVFDGKPIELKIKRDRSLGIIKGIVKTRDAQRFIEGASVTINSDTVIYSNKNGIFNVVLPLSMQVDNPKTPYTLSIKKEGFKIKNYYYYPKISDLEILLESIEQ